MWKVLLTSMSVTGPHLVRRWIAARPRHHTHYTPTYASWMNQVEIWFNIITKEAIRHGTFRGVADLIVNVERFVGNYNP